MLEPGELPGVVRDARRRLATPGVFVFDIYTPDGMMVRQAHLQVLKWPGAMLVRRSTLEPATGVERLHITGLACESRLWRRFDERDVQRGYRLGPVRGVLNEAGFDARVYNGDTLRRVRRASQRLAFVCRPRGTD